MQKKVLDTSKVVFLHQVCDLYLHHMQAQAKTPLYLDNPQLHATLGPLHGSGGLLHLPYR